jgi:MYXO-CTERM domain-containing protein
MRNVRSVALAVVFAACSQSTPVSVKAEGPVAKVLADAAAQSGVPRDLLAAMAKVEDGLRLAAYRLPDPEDHVPIAGMFELRHGAFNSLAAAAAIAGTDELTLRADTDGATMAGAMVLAELGANTGAQPDDLLSWRAALEEMSGHATAAQRADFAERVFAVARKGGAFPARAGEIVVIPAHAELPPAVEQVSPPLDTAEFPGAIWFTTPEANKWTSGRPDGNASVVDIVIHDTEGGWDASVATLQNDGGKSVHYIVDADGSRVGQFVHETDTAWHDGNWVWNTHSIGIEHVGYVADNRYQDGLYDKSVLLVQSIRSRWSVPLDRAHIVGHYQIPNGNLIPEASPACTMHIDLCEASANYGGAGNHRDPGQGWMWCQYMEKLGGSCTCADAWNLWNCTTDLQEAVRCNNNQVEIQHCGQGCVVQPVGVNDICNGASGGAGGSGGSGGAGGTPGSGGAGGSGGSPGSGGSGGAGGAGGSGGVAGGSGGSGGTGTTNTGPGALDQGGGCSAVPNAPNGLWLLLGLGLLTFRRRR